MKCAFVTGGTRGIGFAICRALIERGYAVIATYLHCEKDAEEAQKRLPAARFIKADVADEESVKNVIAQIPQIDLLVNNAGISLIKQVQDIDAREWDEVFSVNAKGAFLCCKHAVKKMIARQSGAIVNISSVWGQTGGSCESAYSASKGALIAFTKALAKELAPSCITVNCVCPGVIETQMNARFSQAELSALREEIPLGRLGTGEEVAAAVLFLAENRYVTGQILGVNGGFVI